MTQSIYLKNLEAPTRIVDAVLDTDAYNEIDDQFAIAYLLKKSGSNPNPRLLCDAFL